MSEDQAREEIAFIRRAIEEGHGYASARGLDMVVWGIAVAFGYLVTYAFERGWLYLDLNWLWTACIGLPWLFSLRRVAQLVAGGPNRRVPSPMAQALRMLWLGCGIFLTTLYLAAMWTGDIRQGWFGAVAAGVLGVGFFASAWLSNLAWLRWVGLAWWTGELAVFALRHRPEAPLLGAALMLLLLAGPGVVLWTRRRPAA